ncbi:MAG: ADP-ribosylation factor-like protein [Candidatus Hodarchaeales archaeon]|jgi:GTPase SAR1 family protein
MSTWISEQELSTRLGFKILIAGLSEAGKTAVKRIFFMKQQTGDVDKLSATINYERMAMTIKDVPVTIVDLGGQRVFIRRFLSNISPFIFSTVQVFLFVIDVSEKTSRNNAIQYFTSCVEKLKEYSPDAKFFVFLHKNDLVRSLPNYESIHSQLKEQFQIETDNKVHFLRTTIYRPDSVIDSFGRIFELAMPSIAQSDYVEGRTIGEIEEYAVKFFTVEMQDEVCPNCLNTLVESEGRLICNFCHYERKQQRVIASTETLSTDASSAALEQLQAKMIESMVTDEKVTPSSPVTTQSTTSASDGAVSVDMDKLKSLMRSSLVKGATKESEPAVTSPVSSHPIGTPTVSVDPGPSSGPVDPDKLKKMMQASLAKTAKGFKDLTASPQQPLMVAAAEEIDKEVVLSSSSTTPETPVADKETEELRVPYLKSFYGVSEEEAENLLQSGYDRLFETAATAGVPVNILLNTFFKFVPYLKNKELIDDNFEDRLMKVLLALLKGLMKEDELFETLVYAMKNPDMSMEDIANEYVEELRQKKEEELKQKTAEAPPKPEKITPEVKTLPDELDKNIIALPGSEGIGFKIEKEEANFNLTFYKGNNRLGNNLLSEFVTFRDLMYLLAFEADIPVKENYKEYVSQIAPIIHTELGKVIKEEKEKAKKATLEEKPPSTVPSDELVETMPKAKKPALESSLIPILKSQQFFFKIQMGGKRIGIIFSYRGQDVCRIDLPVELTKSELGEEILKDPDLSVLISEGDISVFSQIIFSKIQVFKKKIVQLISKQQGKTPSGDEEASEMLGEYLESLKSS